MSHEQLIEALGGYVELAKTLGAPRTTILSWKQRGVIPWRWRAHIAAMAKSEGIKVPPKFFDVFEDNSVRRC